MVTIKPFKGWFYDVERVGDINKVVSPPHDVISEEEQERLYEKSEYNAVRLILSKEGHDAAAERMDRMVAEGIVVQDEEPAYYVYEQEYEQNGHTRKRLGLLALVRADPLGQEVLPHEMIFPEKADDRLELFSKLKANLSPVFGLYADESFGIREILNTVREEKPLFEFRDDYGVLNRLWAIRDTDLLTELFKDEKIIIADGHHRYTAASKLAGSKGEPYTLMYLVDVNDPALTVLPTHRLLKHTDFDMGSFIEKASEFFHILESKDLWELESALSCSDKHTFGLHTRERSYILRLKDINVIEELVDGQRSRDWKHLEVSVLHDLIMKKIFGPHEDLAYSKHRDDVIDLIEDGTYDVAFLLRNSDVDEVIKIVRNKEVMPHKSTYFYPKPLAGLVIRRFDD